MIRSNHEHRPDPQHQDENARNSLSSEEIASDEGVEEAPSQSEGEGGPEPNNNNIVDESSPEREMESDWSSGPSEAQRQASQEEPPSAPEVLPAPAPPPADPQVPLMVEITPLEVTAPVETPVSVDAVSIVADVPSQEAPSAEDTDEPRRRRRRSSAVTV